MKIYAPRRHDAVFPALMGEGVNVGLAQGQRGEQGALFAGVGVAGGIAEAGKRRDARVQARGLRGDGGRGGHA